MSDSWLKCSVHEGMFSDEMAVTIPDRFDGGFDTSVFVPRETVQAPDEIRSMGLVRVRTFRRDSIWWAVLPTVDSLAIPVRASDLVPA